MVYLLLAEGFEEIEALTPLDILRRAGIEVKTVAVGANPVRGAHGIPVVADITADGADAAPLGLILPGGMPGAKHLDASPLTDRLIAATLEAGGHIGAICAAPMVLGRRGLLSGRRAVCFPGFDTFLIWTIPGASFVCLEPWCGITDRIDTNQDITTKEKIQVLAPGDVFTREHAIEIVK